MSLPDPRAYLRVLSAACAGAVLALCCAQAQETHSPASPDRAHIEEVLRGMNRGRSIGNVAVSPDGARLAWIGGSRDGMQLLVAPIGDTTKSEHVTAATKSDQYCHEGEIAWAPDSKSLVFSSDCAKPGTQPDYYFSRLDGSPARRLTELNGYVRSPTISPDGSKLAFLYVEGATRAAGALAAMKPPSGVIGEDNVEVQGVAAVPIDGTDPRKLIEMSPASLHVYEFAWSPDSQSIAYVAADPPGENNWWVAKLYTQRIPKLYVAGSCLKTASGDCVGPPDAILSPADVAGPLHGLQIAVPRWSPDGKAIAFIGGLMSDQGSTGGDVWIISASGGEPHDLTPNRPSSPGWIEWSDNEHLFVSEVAGGNCQLVPLHIRGDRASPGVASSPGTPIFSFAGTVGDGRMEMSLSSTADHSLWVFRGGSFDHPPEVFAARAGSTMSAGGGLTQLTHLNDGIESAWGKTVSLAWTSEDLHVQGWLILPKDYDSSKKYPLIVEVHGGPAAATLSRWGERGGISATAFSALGYFVLLPNPRGSYGQGEAFVQANRKDFGYGDLRDILAGVDAAEAKYPIDNHRVGLTGWSYGGFMTMFAITQTNRFRAAVAGAGISDWLSYYGENSIDQWMIPYFGASVYDDPAVYAKMSAINFIKQAKTPTLAVVGDRDGECPAPQSYEFWHALRDLHVPTELVVYPNEGHGFVNPEHRRDVMVRAVDWFAKYMPAE